MDLTLRSAYCTFLRIAALLRVGKQFYALWPSKVSDEFDCFRIGVTLGCFW